MNGYRHPPAPIGSYFELPDDDLCRGSGISVPAGARLVQSGRQAIDAVLQALTNRADKRVRVPSYLCDSMIAPFIRHGWDVLTYPLDANLQLRPADLVNDSGEVWLLAPYFGRHLDPEVSAWAATRGPLDAPIVLDQTHCVLSPDPTPATFTVASLRKTLPVPEGGYVSGIGDIAVPRTSEFDIGLAVRDASIQKSHALRDHSSFAAANRTFAAAERMVEVALQPAAMLADAVNLLNSLDAQPLIARRASNARILADGFRNAAGIQPLRGVVESMAPAYLVCRVKNATALQRRLATESIFCPIHWPQPKLIAIPEWRTDLISFPVDHRYGARDMNRIVDTIRTLRLEPL